MSRRLLAQSLHASESRASAGAAAELREMLKDASCPAEAAAIRSELEAAEKGAGIWLVSWLSLLVTCCDDA